MSSVDLDAPEHRLCSETIARERLRAEAAESRAQRAEERIADLENDLDKLVTEPRFAMVIDAGIEADKRAQRAEERLAVACATLERIGDEPRSREELSEWDHADVYNHLAEFAALARAALAEVEKT